MKIISFLLLLMMSIDAAVAQSSKFNSTLQLPQVKKSENTNLAGFTVGYEFCQRVQQIAPLLQAYSAVQWPIAGVPGFTFGMVQNESVIYKICDFVVQLESLNTEGAIFHSARQLNEITGEKWDAHLNQANLMWDVSNSIYDFRAGGKFRQGALTSSQTHNQLVQAADKTMQYYQKQRQDPTKDGPPEGIEDKYERRQKLDKIAQLSYQRAILQEATACPVAETKGQDNQKAWNNEVTKKQENITFRRENIVHYETMLRRMGPDFITEVADLQEYINLLEGLIDNGYSFDYTIRYVDVPRKAATGKLKKDGAPDVKDTVEKRPYQFIRVIQNTQAWQSFQKKFVPRWQNYMKGQLLSSGTFGLLDDKKGRIEAKYKSYSWECSERQIGPRLPVKDKNDPQYWPALNAEVQKCRDRIKFRENDAESILERYIRMLQNDLAIAKRDQASIWTFESKFTGVMPLQKETANSATNAAEQETRMKVIQANSKDCRPEFTPAEMEKLGLDLQNVNNELTETLAKSETERSISEGIRAQEDSKAIDQATKNTKAAIQQGQGASNGPGSGQMPIRPMTIKGL